MKYRSVIRLRHSPGGRDENDDPIPGTTARTTIDGVQVAPRYGGDTGEAQSLGRHGVIIGLTLYRRNAPLDLTRNDQVEVDGDVYDIDGEVGRWDGGIVFGSEVALRRAVG